jgi:hypothetical protein
MSGCLYCTNSVYCAVWQTDNANPQSIWKDYLGVWIALIVIGGILLFLLGWKLFLYLFAPHQSYIKPPVNTSVTVHELTQPNE